MKNHWFLASIIIFFATQTIYAASDQNCTAAQYLTTLDKAVQQTRQNIPHIDTVANQAVDRFIKSGKLYLAGEPGFQFEQWGRASGMAAAMGWDSKNTAQHNDVILLALKSGKDQLEIDQKLIEDANKNHAKIIVFASAEELEKSFSKDKHLYDLIQKTILIDNHTHEKPFSFVINANTKKEVSISGIMNILNGWLFHGELAAAATRKGMMPVFWYTFALDERQNYARAHRLSASIEPGKLWGEPTPFHTDIVVPPIKAGYVSNYYLNAISGYLAELQGPLWPKMKYIIRKIIAAKQEKHNVFLLSIGHVSPAEVPQPERNEVFTLFGYDKSVPFLQQHAKSGDLLVVLAMPTYPSVQVEAALSIGMHVIVMSTEKPDVAASKKDFVYWVPAPWPIEDGVVPIKGYDIPILPVTGFMNSVIFYMLRSEVQCRMQNQL